jgi:hypothetical protein
VLALDIGTDVVPALALGGSRRTRRLWTVFLCGTICSPEV